MRRDTFLHRRRVLLAIGVLAACATAAATAAPAYAGPAIRSGSGSGSGSVSASRSATPSASAPISGHLVAGAVFGAAARRGNGSAVTDFIRAHKRMLSELHATSGVKPSSKLHDWWGSFPDTDSGSGVMATQSVSSTLRLSHPGDILYAPTMTPADNSCIEVVTMHNATKAQIWAWDWCGSVAPGARVNVNSSFLKTYTTTVNGRTAYTTKDVRTNTKANTWTAYLYNYQTSAWDKLFTSSGSDKSGLSYGWDMFEFYSSTDPSTGNTYVCGDFQSSGTQIESSSIKIRSGNTWNLANSSNSSWSPEADPNPASYLCPDMQFNIVTNNSDWMVDVAS